MKHTLRQALTILVACVCPLASAQFSDQRNNQYSIYYVGDFLNDNGKSVMTDMNDPKGPSDELWFTGHAETQAGIFQPFAWRQTINGPKIDQFPLGGGYLQGKSLAIESLIPVGNGPADTYHAVGARQTAGPDPKWHAVRWRKPIAGSVVSDTLPFDASWSESWATGVTYDTVGQESLTVGEFVSGGTRQAVVWGGTSGVAVLPLLGGDFDDGAVARQIRNRKVVGSCFDFETKRWQAVVWTKVGTSWSVEEIGMGSFANVTKSFGMAINTAGDVVGTVFANGKRRGFYRLSGAQDASYAPDLSAFEGNDNSALYGINDAKWMVGESYSDFSGKYVPMLIYPAGGTFTARSVTDSPVGDGYGGSLFYNTPDYFEVDDPHLQSKVGFAIGNQGANQLPALALTGLKLEKMQALMVRCFLSTDGQDGMGIGKVLIKHGNADPGDTLNAQGVQLGRTNSGDTGPMSMNEDKLCNVRFELLQRLAENSAPEVWMRKDAYVTETARFVIPLHWAGGTVRVSPLIPGFYVPNDGYTDRTINPLQPVITVDAVSGKQVGDFVTLKAKIGYPGLEQKYIGKVNLKFQIYLNGQPSLDLGEAETNAASGEATKNLTLPPSIGIGNREIRVTFAGRFNQPDATQYWPWLKAATGTAPMTLVSNTVVTVPTVPASPGSTVELNAQLSYQGAPTSGIANQQLAFKVNGQAIGTAMTDFAGVARLIYKVPINQQTDLPIEVTFDSAIADLVDSVGNGLIDVSLTGFEWSLRQSLISGGALFYESGNPNWGQFVFEASCGEPIVYAVGGDATYNARWIIRAGFWQAALAIPWLPDFTLIGR